MNIFTKTVMFLMFFIWLFFVSCQSNQTSNERMPVEVSINIPDAVGSITSSRPIVYGLIQNQPYRLLIYAEKYTYKVDGEMQIELTVPDNVCIMKGEITWLGTDKSKTLEIVIIPSQTGNFVIKATARNLDSGFTITTDANIHVESTSDEVQQWLNQNK